MLQNMVDIVVIIKNTTHLNYVNNSIFFYFTYNMSKSIFKYNEKDILDDYYIIDSEELSPIPRKLPFRRRRKKNVFYKFIYKLYLKLFK